MPSPPPQAIAAGFTRLVFYDDFTSSSTIDLANTKAAGFKWYPNNSWSVNLGSAVTQNYWNNTPPTDASLLSITPGGLLISSDTSGFASSLQSAVYTGGGPGAGATYRGTTFTGGWYVEVGMKYDPANSPAGGSGPGNWPAYWFVPISYLTGNLASGTPTVEFDGYEAAPSTPGVIQPTFALNDATDTPTTGSLNSNINASQIGNPIFSGVNFNLDHKYGSRYRTQLQNAGFGEVRRYFDNQDIAAAAVTFSVGTTVNPGLSPGNPVGGLAEMDNDTYIMLIGTGLNFPLTIRNVAIWQP